MGNGKTTLVKDRISKALKDQAFIVCISDSSYFDGHCYTYEGSNGSMYKFYKTQMYEPVFYFDELDKISDTHKGDEIIHLFMTSYRFFTKFIISRSNYFPVSI